MNKFILLATLLVLILNPSFGQKVISGKSSPKRMTLTPEYERGLPPNLFVNLSFEDHNGNGILEPNESAEIVLSITNKGKGAAQGLIIVLNFFDNRQNPGKKRF